MNGNGFERIDIATTRAQFGKLCDSPSSVAKGHIGTCEKREARIGALYCIGGVNHGCLSSPSSSQSVLIHGIEPQRSAARRLCRDWPKEVTGSLGPVPP